MHGLDFVCCIALSYWIAQLYRTVLAALRLGIAAATMPLALMRGGSLRSGLD